MLATTARCASRCVSRSSNVIGRNAPVAAATTTNAATQQRRSFASDDKKPSGGLPFGLGKIFDTAAEPDNLIDTDRDRKLHKGDIPDFVPPDLKKEMDEIGVDNLEDLDDLEAENYDGFNDLGLVPPEGTGTFTSPILVPSQRATRQVGYTDPETHAVFWFTLHNDNNTYYIKDLGLFFKMLHIPPDEGDLADAHH